MFASDKIRFRTTPRWGEKANGKASSQHDQVMHGLGLGIVGGEFAENTMLPNEVDLLARFAVSRTVLREALKSLSAKGMILARAKVGTRVTLRRDWNYFDPDILFWHATIGIDRSFLFNLAEMRLAFEPEAAALAAERRSDAHLVELAECIDEMERSHSSAEGFVGADLRFHTAIAEASGNPLMRSICYVIQVALEAAFMVSSPISSSSAHALSVARHRMIAQAIELRDPDSARAAMRAVILQGLKRIEAV
ncbi:FadR/GntR family transcriptional regulator [Aureimonas psammosilenae]|uniref:FadR/GntR family transcriptional regulator n=1 Tax=Aureimonas psammosilenae TaxID=2495496 RepID=UPI001260CEF3|nr:FadR/GntR family transcriptional regulator [Aureimonas psammosilenae]